VWFFLLRRVRLVVLGAVLLPLVAVLARRVAQGIESRKERPTPVSRGLRLVEASATKARSWV
jgi:hypothetical protein